MKSSLALVPLSTIYSVVTRTRLAAYRRGWLSVSRLAVPVISVGNLTTGGTGKTPLVEWVCRTVNREITASEPVKGPKVCVLTRGYGRSNPNQQVVVSNGVELLAKQPEAGDEPILLAENLLGIAAVVANADRLAAGNWAIKELGAECFVLDDGFQHLRLARDLDIVTIDATNPWGGDSLLPLGRLREPLSGLSRADCIVITRADQVEDPTSFKRDVEKLADGVPVFLSRMLTSNVRRLDGGAAELDGLKSLPLGAFCGVGNPDSFFTQLASTGIATTFKRVFADHHGYNQADLDALVREAVSSGAEGLITTAKDATKLAARSVPIPCYILDIRIKIDEEDRLVELVRTACTRSRVNP